MVVRVIRRAIIRAIERVIKRAIIRVIKRVVKRVIIMVIRVIRRADSVMKHYDIYVYKYSINTHMYIYIYVDIHREKDMTFGLAHAKHPSNTMLALVALDSP